MEGSLQVFYSNRVERLYSVLKNQLFKPSISPFATRYVIVPSPAMKTWLMARLADDPDIGIAAGITVSFLEPTLHVLLDSFASKTNSLPKKYSHLELSLRIEREIRRVLHRPGSERNTWAPLVDYLYGPQQQKTDRRLIALSDKLAFLFSEYGKYGTNLLRHWKESSDGGWQGDLWRKLVGETWPEQLTWKASNTMVHLFAMSFLSRQQHQLLASLSQTIPVDYYLLSPCEVFWSDILSDREGRWLQDNWEQRADAAVLEPFVEEYLYNRNPLLANFGRLGRDMAVQIEESHAITEEVYVAKRGASESILEAIQADLLELRNPDSHHKTDYPGDASLQVHVASSRMREVQVLYDAILRIIEKHAGDENPILPEDFIVMAPEIMDYDPFIRAVFHTQDSVLDCQIMDLQIMSQSSLVQGFFHLLLLASGRWDAASLLQLFEFPAFQRKQGFDGEDLQKIRSWVKKAEVRWGEDAQHRQELLRCHHASCELVDASPVGTWKHGMDRLLLGLAMVSTGDEPEDGLSPLSILGSTEAELLGKWIALIRSLRDDLEPLSDGSKLSLNQWSAYLKSLFEAYFSQISTENCGEDEIQMVYHLIDSFHFEKELGRETFPFASIKHHLEAAAKKQRICYRESHLHAVKFCSLLPMRAVPSKVVVLLGMEEGVFPRVETDNSLNYLRGSPYGDYYPTTTDFDRYLFLEIILSARQYFLVTFTGYSREDSKEQPPSLLITELLSYLDKGYTIDGKVPSEQILRHHPFQAYDKTLFTNDFSERSYSHVYYRAAKAYYKSEKSPKHSFVPHFGLTRSVEAIETSYLDLWQLSQMARNPIKAYFNITLGIRLENEEERLVKTDEDFLLNGLDSDILKKNSLKQPLEIVLKEAEKAGRLPVGPFKKYSIGRVTTDVEDVRGNLRKLGINPDELFEIEFSTSCEAVSYCDGVKWMLPPLQVTFRGQPLTITGTLKEVSDLGLVAYIKDEKKDIIKNWPQYLVFSCLAAQYDLPMGRGLVFAKSGSIKEPFFSDPFKLLETYLEYYFHALENISPLIPDWMPDLMEKEEVIFEKKVRDLLMGNSPYFYNDYLKWMTQGSDMPEAGVMLAHWKVEAQKLYGELYKNWFAKRVTARRDG